MGYDFFNLQIKTAIMSTLQKRTPIVSTVNLYKMPRSCSASSDMGKCVFKLQINRENKDQINDSKSDVILTGENDKENNKNHVNRLLTKSKSKLLDSKLTIIPFMKNSKKNIENFPDEINNVMNDPINQNNPINQNDRCFNKQKPSFQIKQINQQYKINNKQCDHHNQQLNNQSPNKHNNKHNNKQNQKQNDVHQNVHINKQSNQQNNQQNNQNNNDKNNEKNKPSNKNINFKTIEKIKPLNEIKKSNILKNSTNSFVRNNNLNLENLENLDLEISENLNDSKFDNNKDLDNLFDNFNTKKELNKIQCRLRKTTICEKQSDKRNDHQNDKGNDERNKEENDKRNKEKNISKEKNFNDETNGNCDNDQLLKRFCKKRNAKILKKSLSLRNKNCNQTKHVDRSKDVDKNNYKIEIDLTKTTNRGKSEKAEKAEKANEIDVSDKIDKADKINKTKTRSIKDKMDVIRNNVLIANKSNKTIKSNCDSSLALESNLPNKFGSNSSINSSCNSSTKKKFEQTVQTRSGINLRSRTNNKRKTYTKVLEYEDYFTDSDLSDSSCSNSNSLKNSSKHFDKQSTKNILNNNLSKNSIKNLSKSSLKSLPKNSLKKSKIGKTKNRRINKMEKTKIEEFVKDANKKNGRKKNSFVKWSLEEVHFCLCF